MAKNRLGKGLGALLPDKSFNAEEKEKASGGSREKPEVRGEILVSPEKLVPNPAQPRKRFDETGLEELAASIKQHGIIQPIIVDEGSGGDYVIVAGERRSRAARIAGLSQVPVIVRNYSTRDRLEIALIENIHRSDLNPIEEASAYRQIMESGGLSQDETAERVGKNRSTVANALRLLKLPPAMQSVLEDGGISPGHARAILSLPRPADQEKLFNEISAGGLSVRAAEKRAAELSGGKGPAGKTAGVTGTKRDPELKAIEEKFISVLGTKVSINGTLARGRIEIEYYSMDDLDRLYGIIKKDP